MSHMNSNFMWKIVALGREMLSELSKQCNLLHLYNEYRKGENVTHIYWHCPWWKQQLWPPCTNWQTYLTFHFQLALCIDGKNTTHKPVTWWDHISAPTWTPIAGILSLKQQAQRTEKDYSEAVREKKQVMYKGKPIKITADFSMETLKVRRA
jgi:hypothetical protein